MHVAFQFQKVLFVDFGEFVVSQCERLRQIWDEDIDGFDWRDGQALYVEHRYSDRERQQIDTLQVSGYARLCH